MVVVFVLIGKINPHWNALLLSPREAWELARAWPGVELLIDDHSGHRGSDLKRTWMLETLAKFASR